jgi:predicted 3-demethylubiquinone-9 3-methyltransferase (glyoxalase superfamily)
MQKLIPCFWFNNQTEEAIKFYMALFDDSKMSSELRFVAGPAKGSLCAEFSLQGYEFQAFDGGPYFEFSPAVSISINIEDEQYLTILWNTLIEGGQALMPFQTYDFSKKYGWLNDKFGVSWQLNFGKTLNVVSPSFMFIGENYGKAEEAMCFYTSIFKDSSIDGIYRYGDENPTEKGNIAHAEFKLAGQSFIALDSGIDHKFEITPALSMVVMCDTQSEIDYYWEKLSVGGSVEQCGWLKDKYGISWQIVPVKLMELLKDPTKAEAATNAMLKMVKLDLNLLETL